jgi:hypothetical protein
MVKIFFLYKPNQMKQFLLIFTAAFYLLSCQNKAESSWQTMTFLVDKPLLTHINLGDSANSHGDAIAYEQVLRDSTGKVVGEVLGWGVTVDIVDGDSANPIHISDRIGTAVFKFDDENQIIALGGTTYQNNEKLMKVGIALKRAIIGGTGKYKGITGDVTTYRFEDGSYKQVLDVKMAN